LFNYCLGIIVTVSVLEKISIKILLLFYIIDSLRLHAWFFKQFYYRLLPINKFVVMDSVDGDDPVSDNGVAVCDSAPVRSELLCFVRDKSRIIPYDDLVKVCCDFYSSEEIGLHEA